MNRVYQAETLHMSWCLDCHRNPAPHLRPPDQVFNLDRQPPPDSTSLGRQLMAEFDIDPSDLDSCYVCHR